MAREVRLARIVFRGAAIWGLLVLPPLFFLPLPDPYRLNLIGFAGAALVFQGMFWIIARDPLRYLPLIALSVFEKLSYGVPAIAFWAQGRADGITAFFGAADLLLGAAFAVIFQRLRRAQR